MAKNSKKGVKMSKRNRILGAGLDVLMSAHKEGSTRSREIDKEKGIDNKFIYADVSYKNHKNNWRQFSKWANENGLKRVGQITRNDVEKYVRECAENGLSKKTIESRIGAINKVMLASERWKNENRVILSKIEGIAVKKLPTKVYKDLTAKEWQDRNPKQYENNRELIDTVQAFGLRRREARELNAQSFLIDDKGKMYVQTVGKGNKYRIAPVCDSEMNEQMRERWGDKAIPLQ
ncbi:MAG: site-specific integrase, partial [Streptococcus parasanguinis]|nr:site-specific integrase [Streptococcus parasanguinis]